MSRNISKLITNYVLFGLIFASALSSISAQTFSNEKIWGGEFRSEGVWGIRSMANGSHYTVSDYDQDPGSTIEKYSYSSGKKVSTIVTALDAFEDARESFSS